MTTNKKWSKIHILRSSPKDNSKPYYQEYIIPLDEGSTIMDGLMYIYTHLDSSLAFRVSCGNGWCNVCGVMVNKKVMEPCKHRMMEEMIIEPVPNIPVIRDLIVDREKCKNWK